MQEVNQALNEVKELYRQVLGTQAPEIRPDSYASFPPGVDPLNHAIEEVHRLRQYSDQLAAAPGPVSWIPQADTFLTRDACVVRLEVPGVARDGLKVFVAGGECVVRGERKLPEAAADVRPLAIERAWGRFERRFVLPVGCRSDGISARYLDGVLELRIPVEQAGTQKETKVEVA